MNRVRTVITTFSDTRGTLRNNMKQTGSTIHHNIFSQIAILVQAQWGLQKE